MIRIGGMVHSLRWPAAAGTGIAVCCLLTSCEKVVSIDPGSADPQMVVQGLVTDAKGPYRVVLNKTADYFARSSVFPPVSHAAVVIADDLGKADTLRELGNGVYGTKTLRGMPGRRYILSISAEGKNYSATSSMPARVPIASLAVSTEQRLDGSMGYDIDVAFKDPPEPGNYYRLDLQSLNGLTDAFKWHHFILYSDRLANGNDITYRVRLDRNAVTGDSITVGLMSLDKSAYDYFSGLNDILTSADNPIPFSPANPSTNISNGSLGYFAACSVDFRGITLK